MAGLRLVVAFLFASSAGAVSPFLSPAKDQAASTQVTDLKGIGRKMAEDLEKLLPRETEPSTLLEPSIDQPREDQKEKETRGEIIAGASTFNAASGENSAEQQAVEDALREAMVSSSSQLGAIDRHIENNLELTCLPDFMKCPEGWTQEGVLCSAGSDYKGECATEADLSEMSVEQKLAFAAACSIKFPCQGSCEGGQDFRQTCPSLWHHVTSDGICQAPLEYVGSCSARVNTATMTAEEKYTWSVRCAARWPCAPPMRHNYEDVCPQGWSLSAGQVCTAPSTYKGPCEHTAYMSSATNADKKAFEASCQVEWEPIDGFCVHDYTAACPFGWHSDPSGCVAPATYEICSTQKSFTGMTPAAKEDWAKMCKVEFPCQDRSSCKKAYSAPCPAEWYSFNGGMSCTAPSQYGGSCASVLHGLADLTKSEKQVLEGRCGFAWPCQAEVYGSMSESRPKLEPRLTVNLGQL
jgi:CPW-WPC domain-containing protein